MADQVKIVITGVSGRMGQMLVHVVQESTSCKLHAVTERPGHEWIGQDLGVAMGGAAIGVSVTDHPSEAFKGAGAIIDFTAPMATLAHALAAAGTGAALIVGTTGFSAEEIAELERSGTSQVIVRAGNMSLGVNLLTQLTKKVAEALDADFDIEIVEAHHKHKVDAPSGTALMLGEAAAEGRGISLSENSDRVRDGITGPRARGTIGFQAIRGGDVVGEHDVIFAAAGERIVLRHLATDRAIFARGAIKAALWAQGQSVGNYSMIDVLGL